MDQQMDQRTDTPSFRDVWTHLKTRPDTRPSVAYGWAWAVMLKNQRKRYFYESVTNGRTDGLTDGPKMTKKAKKAKKQESKKAKKQKTDGHSGL